MVAGEAEDAVASDELAPGPEVLGVGRGRWGSSSPVQTMTVGRDGWRWRARAAAKELRQVERKQKGTQPRRGSYAWDKGAARTRRWRLHARRGERRGWAGRQHWREVAGGRSCHRGVGALTWVRARRDTRPWASVDGLVASGPNRRRAVLYCAVGRAR
jgi:hypothetical protein